MVPIIQFDPATMALVYDGQLIAGGDKEGRIMDAVGSLIAGQSDDSLTAIDAIEDPETRDRALQIVSALWHEKRHYADFMLSNYGAFRFRQFLDMYVNLPQVLRTGVDRGVIHAPLEVYNDPVRSEIMGITDPPAELKVLGQALSRRRRMLERDRAPIESRFGLVELGGEALLECLAVLAQLDFVACQFGEDGQRQFYRSLFNRDYFFRKYLAVLEWATRLGIAPSTTVEDALQVDPVLLECVLFAALQTDHVAPSGGPYATSYAGERFAGICIELAQTRHDLCSAQPGALEFDTCWKAVDDICLRLFGHRVLAQMLLDFDHFHGQTQARIIGNVPDDLEAVITDYFDLRRRMLAEFAVDPQLFISSRRFTLELADRLHPNYVLAAANGVIGDAPEGYDRLMGYRHDEGAEERPYRKWWWACSPTAPFVDEPAAGAAVAPTLRFAHPRVWYGLMDYYAPIAKLLMNGRRLRTLIGPELMFAEQRLKSSLSIDVEIYPSFAFPDESFSAEIFYYYFGKGELKCDWTSESLAKPSGRALSPWTLRRWPKLGHAAIERLGGNDLAYFTFVRDWSPWVISEAAFHELKAYMN